VQHPKPHPTPSKCEVFKFASDLKTLTAVEAEGCSKESKKDVTKENINEEKKKEIPSKTASGS
jgi:hypothetical protein